jgi:hypothetical protein
MKNLYWISLLLILGINNSFSQSKKERIEILNARIDSLNNQLNLQKRMSSKVQLENHELSLKLEESDEKVVMLNSLLANLELQLKTLPVNIDTNYVINEKNILTFLKRISQIELRIPISNFYTKKKINNYTVYELDFSKEPIDSLSQKYNVQGPEGLEVRIAIDDEDRLLFVKFKVDCCPFDNNEGMIFLVGNKLLSIYHYFGMFGGDISVKLDGLETGSLGYLIEEEERSNYFLNIFNE